MRRLVFAMTLALLVMSMTARAQQTPPPPGWTELLQKSLDLTLQNKPADVLALVEPWVAQHPDFPDGHAMLGGAYENLGLAARTSGAPDAIAKSAKLYETAAAHLRRAVDLEKGGSDFSAMRSLIDMYGRLRLNRPAEYERLAREGVTRFPAKPLAHAYAICATAVNGGTIDAAVRTARAAVPNTPDAYGTLGGSLLSCAREWPDEEHIAAPILRQALDFTTTALKLAPSDVRLLEQRSAILREQARRPGR